MESFMKFSRGLLVVSLAGFFAGKIIFDLISGAFMAMDSIGGAILSVFSFGTFATLTMGFILCIIWILINLFAFLFHK
jgi:hypothetical protein